MSYASMTANTIINLLKPDKLLMLAEGLSIFRAAVPASYVGKSLAESQIRTKTDCNVIAIYDQRIKSINPGPSFRFRENNELILIGSGEAESLFFKLYSEMKKIKASYE